MSDRTTCSVGDLCAAGLVDLQTGPFGTQLHAYDYVANGVPVVPTEAIRERRIDPALLPQITAEKAVTLARHRLVPGDILFARRGVQATGHIAYVRPSEAGYLCGTGAIRLRVAAHNATVSAEFLSHVFANPASIAWFKFHAIGATMPNLNEGIIRSFPLALPPLDEQNAVARLLSDLDDKIAVNDSINAAMEAVLRITYRDWFVSCGPTTKATGVTQYLSPRIWNLFPKRLDALGVPEGWTRGTLSDIASSVGQMVNPASVPPDCAYVGLEHMPRRSIALGQWSRAQKVASAKLAFRQGDFLFGKLRPYFHKVGVAAVDGICSTDIVVVRALDPADYAFVIACISSDEFVAYTNHTSGGTKMPRTNWESMAAYPIVRPSFGVAAAFHETVMPFIETILSNVRESRALAAARDALVPKLMSGLIQITATEGEEHRAVSA